MDPHKSARAGVKRFERLVHVLTFHDRPLVGPYTQPNRYFPDCQEVFFQRVKNFPLLMTVTTLRHYKLLILLGLAFLKTAICDDGECSVKKLS